MEEQPLDKTGAEFPGVAKASSISLALDDYEDLFSDFDPRPYSERSLSEDFLYELRRASLNKEEKSLVLTMLLPKEKRNAANEKTILERLRSHFRRHHRLLAEKQQKRRRTGAWMIALGIVFMFVATYILDELKQNLLTAFVVVLLEPAGWFTFWEGLSLIVFAAKEEEPELVFYRKMSGAKINFAPEPPPKEAAPPAAPKA